MPNIDISILGDKELQKKLDALEKGVAAKAVRPALRKESYRTRKRIVGNIQAEGLIKTGVMVAAYAAAKVKSAGRRGIIRIGVENPTRAQLGIDADDQYYYPYAVEFGHDDVEPKPFIRPAIDEHKPQSLAAIARDIAAGILRLAKTK